MSWYDVTKKHLFNIPSNTLEFSTNSSRPKDLKEPYKAQTTKFINEEFLPDSEHVFRFLTLIQTEIENELKPLRSKYNLEENDLVFIYKGGNVLKAIYESIKPQIPQDKLEKYEQYEEYFSKSDLDFGIYIIPCVSDFQTLYNEVQIAVYNALTQIRSKIIARKSHYFPIFEQPYIKINKSAVDKFKTDVTSNPQGGDIKIKGVYSYDFATAGTEINKILGELINISLIDETFSTTEQTQSIIQKLNAILSNIPQNMVILGELPPPVPRRPPPPVPSELPLPVPRRPPPPIPRRPSPPVPLRKPNDRGDFIITNSPTDSTKKLEFPITTNTTDNNGFYITMNNSIEFTGKITVKFALVRMKYNSVFLYENTASNPRKYGMFYAPGEVIDVSITHKDSIGIHVFDNFAENIKEFTYTSNSNKLKFKSYSLLYFIKDLIHMIFLEFDSIYEVEKLEKRINRLLFFYSLHRMAKSDVSDVSGVSDVSDVTHKINFQKYISYARFLFSSEIKDDTYLRKQNKTIYTKNIIVRDENLKDYADILLKLYDKFFDTNDEWNTDKTKTPTERQQEEQQLKNTYDIVLKCVNLFVDVFSEEMIRIIDPSQISSVLKDLDICTISHLGGNNLRYNSLKFQLCYQK